MNTVDYNLPGNPGPAELPHGVTLLELNRTARLAATTSYGTFGLPVHELADAARFGIVELLHTVTAPPSRYTLIRTGQTAIRSHVWSYSRHYGYRDGDKYNGAGSGPRFAKFWHNPHSGSPEEPVVERVAVQQILGTLTVNERRVLEALVEHGNPRDAARACAMTEKNFRYHMANTRRRFRSHWNGDA
jgi:hypothetical protein